MKNVQGNLPGLLIVEDEKNTRDGLRRALEDKFEVYLASDTKAAWNVLESEPVDLLLTDLRLGTESGMDLLEATVRAAHQRLRPILMTSLAFVLGVLPLAIASGAGSGGQNAIGTGVVGGMIAATVLAIFFVPLFFVTMLKIFKAAPASADRERALSPAERARRLAEAESLE